MLIPGFYLAMHGLLFSACVSGLPHWNAGDPGTGRVYNATVYMNKIGSATIKIGVLDPQGAAYGIFNDTLLKTGWGVLDIKSGYNKDQGGLNDYEVMFAAGYLEGYITWQHIYNHYTNLQDLYNVNRSAEFNHNLNKYIQDQINFMEAQMVKKGNEWDPYRFVFQQFFGLIAGYNAAAPSNMQLDKTALFLLNGNGDFLDLQKVIDREHRPDFSKMSKQQLQSYIQKNSHCSALIKVTSGYENIFFSHSSWFLYQATNRIFKYYDFNVDNVASKQVSFSSYPGYLESLDDFYMMGNGLVMLQTTNSVFDMSLYDLVSPHSVPAWMRVRVANMMAMNASEWGPILEKYNSGTYNNQYMILDLNKVHLKESIEDDALWVVEQIPGLVKYAEQTRILRLGYWPSYNVPFFEEVYNKSGYPKIVAEKGPDFSYQLAPRAKIFRQLANAVDDMNSMKSLMRYDDYEHNPYSEGNPCKSICCRGDLEKTGAWPDGCYDTKVADIHMAQQKNAWVINGPTNSDYIKPYTWDQFRSVSHIGLPQTYDFKFILVKPEIP